MLTVAEKEQVTKLVATTVQPLVSEQLKTLLAEELPPLIADALKQNRTVHHQLTSAHPDTRATSAKKSTLNWQTAGVIVLMVSAIIGGWWTLEDRFEKKLETAINGVETRLGGEIQQVRQEVQEVRQEVQETRKEINTRIDEINTRIDAVYQLLLEQR